MGIRIVIGIRACDGYAFHVKKSIVCIYTAFPITKQFQHAHQSISFSRIY